VKATKDADETPEQGEVVEADEELDEYYIVFFPVEQAEECGQAMSEFFLTERECRSDASKNNSFKRSLLNQCQDEFDKQDIFEDWEKEKAAYEGEKDKSTESRTKRKGGRIRSFRKIKIKKQMLGNIKFIGQLYKKGLLKEKIMR
jgi:translation initiation factor 4G